MTSKVSYIAEISLDPRLITSKKCSCLTVDFREYFELTVTFILTVNADLPTYSVYVCYIPLLSILCIYNIDVPYTAKLSRGKTFAVFTVF